MAVALFMRIPELTLERYDALIAGLELDANPPGGAVLHIATGAVGAVNVCEIWRTEQAAESFVEQRLRDALRQQGVKDPLSYRIEPLHNLFAPDLELIDRIGAVSLPAASARSALAS